MIVLYEERIIQGICKYFNQTLSIFHNLCNLKNIEQTQCWIELGSPVRWQLYMSLVAAALFVVPAIIITACYAIIVRTIWAKGALLMQTGIK